MFSGYGVVIDDRCYMVFEFALSYHIVDVEPPRDSALNQAQRERTCQALNFRVQLSVYYGEQYHQTPSEERSSLLDRREESAPKRARHQSIRRRVSDDTEVDTGTTEQNLLAGLFNHTYVHDSRDHGPILPAGGLS